MVKPRIVIIENNLPHRAKIKTILSPIDADYLELSDSKDCLVVLCKMRPDLVLANLKDSSQDGVGLLTLLKKDPSFSDLPVILMGHGESQGKIAAAIDSGVFAYIDATEEEENLLSAVEKLFEKSAEHPAGIRILVVDDSSSVRLMLQKGLSQEGYRVQTAENGKIALKFLHNNRFDLILSDVYMPEMNGLELCETLHGDPLYSGIPFVVMSTENDAGNMKKMMQLGAAAFIIKPFNIEQLLMTLNKIFSYEFLLLLKENERLDGEQKLLLSGITSLIKALEARDEYTRGHSERVSLILSGLVRQLGGSQREIERAQIAGRLHDIGKIGISDNVLLKPGCLSEAEFNHIKTHPTIGASIIQTIPSIADILPVIISHHERFDGNGYPQGLKGLAIPLWARMTAVADTYDALTSDRPYRKGMEHDKALAIITEVAGGQLCPDTVRLFLECCKEGMAKGFNIQK
ncbi:MAG: response regulator [Proteobacteria bacterium]|nr:response regulator [Pseudomonadota bacterium]